MAVLVNCDFEATICALICNYSHIGQHVECAGSVDVDGLVLFHEVTRLSLDNTSETGIQHHQHLVFLLVFQGEIVLLVDAVVTFDGLLQWLPIGMCLLYFTGIIPKDQMVLEWPLEGLAHQILKGNNACFSGELLLNEPGTAVLGQQLFELSLRLVEILEVVRIDQQKLGETDHGLSDQCLSSIPSFKLGIQFFPELDGKSDHTLHVGEHGCRFVGGDALRLHQWLLDAFLYTDQVFSVILLSRHQLTQTIVSIPRPSCQFLPFIHCCSQPHDAPQLGAYLLDLFA